MSYLNRFFSGRTLQAVLLLACFALLSAAIWYLGPFMGFGKTRPLAEIESRCVFILLALLWLIAIWWRLPLFLMVAITAGVVVWELGPYLLMGEGWPLASRSRRLTAVSIIAIITLAYAAWRLLMALSLNPQLLENFIKRQPDKPDSELAFPEIAAVIRNAMSYTRSMRKARRGWRRFFLTSWRHDELPWYLVLGTEKSGKTSLVAASGQDFPLPDQLNRACRENEPTRNCECWFANDALFIDTAGRYVHDASGEVPEWNGILQAIRKYRPVKAINGAIVAISVTEVMGRSKADRIELAAAIRARLGEVRQQLGVRFPVYVVITMLDQLTGFEEYFRNLTAGEREQIWGVTFPYGGDARVPAADLQKQIEHELSLLENRIDHNMHVRQQEEYATVDRKRMYALPQDFGMLSQGIADILQNIFFASRYDETQFYTTLRGIYFSSSCQPSDLTLLNNHTIIQRWRNVVHNKKPTSLAWSARQVGDSDRLITHTAWGRQYFLKQLISEIIIKDADLVSHNLKAESKYRFQNLLGHAACILITLWLLHSFSVSYRNNLQYLNATTVKVQKLEGKVTEYVKTANEKLLPVLLSMTQNLSQFGTLDVLDPAWSFRYGLYIGLDINNSADSFYQFLLQKFLLPQIERRATDALLDAISAGNNGQLYNALKLYLMVYGQGKFDAGFVINGVAQQWEVADALQPYEEKEIFVAHLKNLFDHTDWRRYGQAMDASLVAQARSNLGNGSLTLRLYSRIKESLQQDAPENMTLNKMTGDKSSQILTQSDPELLNNGVSGLFTWEGYYQVVKKKLPLLVATLLGEDGWVMGKQTRRTVNPLAVQDDVLRLYLQEYRAAWGRFLAGIRLLPMGDEQREDAAGLPLDIYVLRTLAAPNSPLIALAQEALKQTTLSVPESSVAREFNVPITSSRTINNVKKVNDVLALHERKLLLEGVDNYFSALRAFVSGNTQPDPAGGLTRSLPGTQLNKMLSLLNDQYTLLVVSNNAMNYGDIPPMSDAGKKLAAESQTWPDPFRNIIEPLLNGAYKRIDNRVVDSSKQTIDSGLGEICRRTLARRYPFADSEQEVSISDFERFFAAGGVADDYFVRNLADKVDVSTRPWRYKGTSSSAGLAVFEQAADIRNTFFQRDGGRKLSVNLVLSVPYMSPAITQLNMSIDGQMLKYTHGPVIPVSVQWPGNSSGGSVVFAAKPQVAGMADDSERRLLSRPGRGADRPLVLNGPWALLRWMEKADRSTLSGSGNEVLTFSVGKRRVDIEMAGLRTGNQSSLSLLKNFRCPGTGG